MDMAWELQGAFLLFFLRFFLKIPYLHWQKQKNVLPHEPRSSYLFSVSKALVSPH